ncbi:sensor histidine kinase [Prevotella aurantiaca]|uniref:Sensor histidine kinase n=1 Tax=Prevotella aurantiaca TaxID=596085 RepID=A0A930HN05_9BACT|nr:sensor histidine kinase [Prevotella aurantiaca]MBF1384643.1 sensor histidine kinase [Prevotella aurantiaca]
MNLLRKKATQEYKENVAHFLLWLLVFIIPVITMFFHTNSVSEEYNWERVFSVWIIVFVFFVAFLIHNFLLLPQIIYYKRRAIYICGTISLILFFTFLQYAFHVTMGQKASKVIVQNESIQNTITHNHATLITQVLAVNMIILVLMFGMNFGVKLFFKSNEDQQKLHDLQEKNLEQQLISLKYQINPHFFMNTLNNIHALVDIDPEKAKWAIIVMSKMMRYILYEGNNTFIPLQKESDFIHSYISLMRMRYTDKVKINLDVPKQIPVGEIPPLLLICFVGNAFKHGISYQQESTIDISLCVEDNKIKFSCINSKLAESEAENGGMGLESVRQRLRLIYPNRHTLIIEDKENTYSVWLELSLTNKE